MNPIVAIALEWWRSGPKTLDRLRNLVKDHAHVYGVEDADRVNQLMQEALDSLPEWERPKS